MPSMSLPRAKVCRALVVAVLLSLAAITAAPSRAADTCGGDCNLDGRVVVNELILGVNIALDKADLSACPAMDVNNGQAVTIADLIAAVGHALNGCPPIT